MGHGVLRVWNDDTIQPASGFDPHPHRDMEIITYVREGAITHIDKLGNRGRTEAGDVQVMHAGTGIVQAEYNHVPDVTHIFQIWIEPDCVGHKPGWATKAFPSTSLGEFAVLASGCPAYAVAGVLSIHQDAAILGGKLEAGERLTHPFDANRRGYLVISNGKVEINGTEMGERDGALTISSIAESELVLVDVP